MKEISCPYPPLLLKPYDCLVYPGQGWKLIEQCNNLRPPEVNLVNVGFTSYVEPGEFWIEGVEVWNTVAVQKDIPYGADYAMELWNEPKHRTLEWIRQHLGVTKLSFFGTLLAAPSGHAAVISLGFLGEEWKIFPGYLILKWQKDDMLVVYKSP